MKRVVQLFVLTSIVLGAVACGSGDTPSTPSVVKIGVDNAGMKKKKADAPTDAKPGDAKPGAATPGAPPAGKPGDAKPGAPGTPPAKPDATGAPKTP